MNSMFYVFCILGIVGCAVDSVPDAPEVVAQDLRTVENSTGAEDPEGLACQLLGCDDGLACTVDTCTSTGCTHVDTSDDANVCTYDDPETCENLPYVAGTPCGLGRTCNGAGDCTFRCDSETDCPAVTPCETRACVAGVCVQEDKDAYTPCGASGLCMGGECYLDDAAPEDDERVAACSVFPGLCDDGNECTQDTCSSEWGCGSTSYGNGRACALGLGRCDWTGGCCLGCFEFDAAGNASCVDACGAGETCDAETRVCEGAAEKTGDGASEETETLACQIFGCYDGNECTVDHCTSVGCQHYPALNGTACSDGGVPGRCNVAECCSGCVADSGACMPGWWTSACGRAGLACNDCDDRNPETLDSCLSNVCEYHPIGDVADDRRVADARVASCQLIGCDDGNPCTDDICQPGIGCVYLIPPDGTDCSVHGGAGVCDGLGACVEPLPGTCGSGSMFECGVAPVCWQSICVDNGCAAVTLQDGTPCGGGTCIDGACVP